MCERRQCHRLGLRGLDPMKRLLWILPLFLLGAAPSRTQTYVSGEVIYPADVTENEDRGVFFGKVSKNV